MKNAHINRLKTAQHQSLSTRALNLLVAAKARLSGDQGDVPGWVLITLMTAGIVLALWAIASDALIGLFQQAIGQFGTK